MYDFRSDTVTKPDEAMRQAIYQADVGDDVYGEDKTTRALEQKVASLLGKEDAVFVSSGTQSNLIAMLTHGQRGDEVISGDAYHVLRYEAGGLAALGGLVPCPLPVTDKGSLHGDDIRNAVKDDDGHFPVSRLLCLENTHNGLVQSVTDLITLCAIAKDNGLACHLDGARLMNAVIASNQSAEDFAQPFDSVSLCLSKGLGAPAGSVLAGNVSFITKARRLRKMVGGGMRQAGILAAAGLYALTHNVERLRDDHRNATLLAERLSEIKGVSIDHDKVQTNMVYLELDDSLSHDVKASLPEQLYAKGFHISSAKSAFRLVVHKDIPEQAISGFAQAIKSCL